MQRTPMTQAELHNQLAPELIARILRSVSQTGGDATDVCVLTESVLIGVAQALERLAHGSPDVLEMICDNAKRRHAQLRLVTNAKGPKQ